MNIQVKIIMNRIIYFFLFSLLFQSYSYAWTIESNFEEGKLGQPADGGDGFGSPSGGGAAGYTYYSNKHVHSGNQSAVCSIDAGTNGWAKWGGSWKYPPLYEGSEIWIRAWVYIPEGFDMRSDSPEGLKFIRIHVSNADGSNVGYNHIFLHNWKISIGTEVKGGLFNNNPISELRLLGPGIKANKWHAYEMYIKHGAPGKGAYRVWQDGDLIFEDTKSGTMLKSGAYSDFIYFFTYWNGNSPKTQSLWVDDIVITNERPNNTDSKGNHYIGIGDFNAASPPNPPSIAQ